MLNIVLSLAEFKDDIKIKFRLVYSGSVVQENRKHVKDVASKIRCRQMKEQKATTEVLCDKKILLKVKEKCYKTVVERE